MNLSHETIHIETVLDRLRGLRLPEVDAVVAIERGGLVPAAIAAAHIDTPLGRIRLRYRNDANSICVEEPQLIAEPVVPTGNRILLIDDVSVTGATLRAATEILDGLNVHTLVLRGHADLVAFPELDTCVVWPWTPATATPMRSVTS